MGEHLGAHLFPSTSSDLNVDWEIRDELKPSGKMVESKKEGSEAANTEVLYALPPASPRNAATPLTRIAATMLVSELSSILSE